MSEGEIIGIATPQESLRAQQFLHHEKTTGRQRLRGELRKTPEERQFIKATREHLQDEFTDLGITDFPLLTQAQFHIFGNNGFNSIFGPNAPDAVTDTMSSAAYMNKDKYESRIAFYIALFHEGMHLVSHQKFQHYQGALPVAVYRAGYTNTDFRKLPPSEHFRGFDEAVVDMAAREIIGNNWEELSKQFHFTPADRQYFESLKSSSAIGYGDYGGVVKFIVRRVAKEENEQFQDVWKRIKKGVFTGEMMHLRDIERAFGKGALRILAHLGTLQGEIGKEDAHAVLKWFQSSSSVERDQIARSFLSAEEYITYRKRQ